MAALMVQGYISCGSNGLLVTALCRWFARREVTVSGGRKGGGGSWRSRAQPLLSWAQR
jgi:hypothetical protein